MGMKGGVSGGGREEREMGDERRGEWGREGGKTGEERQVERGERGEKRGRERGERVGVGTEDVKLKW